MENILVIIIVVAAAYYLWRRFFSSKGKGGCSACCSRCGGDDCESEREKMASIYGIKEKKTDSTPQKEPVDDER